MGRTFSQNRECIYITTVRHRREAREERVSVASHSSRKLIPEETKEGNQLVPPSFFSISLALSVSAVSTFFTSFLTAELPQESASRRESPLLRRSGDPRGLPRDLRLWFFVWESAIVPPFYETMRFANKGTKCRLSRRRLSDLLRAYKKQYINARKRRSRRIKIEYRKEIKYYQCTITINRIHT